MVEKPKHKSNKGLVILLVALVVVILVVGCLVAIKSAKNNSNDTNGGDDALCDVGGDYYEISACIDDIYSENDDIDLVIDEYRTVIDKAKKAGNYELASELIAQRSAALMEYGGYCDKNIELFNNEDLAGYEKTELAYMYSSAVSVAVNCNNEEMESKWFALMVEAQEGIEYEAF